MSWLQVSFVVDAAQAEPVSGVLETFLAQAVTSENAGRDEYYEVAFPGTPDWQKVKLTALFDQGIDPQPIINFVQQHFDSAAGGEIPVTVARLQDQDWERVWLESFQPLEVGENLWVCPSWCEPVDAQARNIILDPGLAFGTGTHATTNLCLQWLARQQLDCAKVLDYGAGSGILAIASLLCGAAHADAVDIDPMAIQASLENAQRNGVANKLDAYLPTQVPQRKYDLVIANILADVIVELRDTLLLHLDSEGTLLLTGILSTQATRVRQAFSEIEFEQFDQDSWCMLIGSNPKQNS